MIKNTYLQQKPLLSNSTKLCIVLLAILLSCFTAGFSVEAQTKTTIISPLKVSPFPYPPRIQPGNEKLPESSSQFFSKQVHEIEIGTVRVVPSESPNPDEAENQDPGVWGVARQIGEHTWTVKLADDDRMGTPQEIFSALNSYRQRLDKEALIWDDALASYAQKRADLFTLLGHTDEHAGFSNFVNNQSGFQTLGFNGLGENSSFGYKLLGVHIIEWMYAADKPHNDNQLNSEWTHVGVGVNGVATDLVFGGRKI